MRSGLQWTTSSTAFGHTENFSQGSSQYAPDSSRLTPDPQRSFVIEGSATGSLRTTPFERSRRGTSLTSTPFPNEHAPREPPQDDFDANSDVPNEVIMAVNFTDRRTVGCAYYVAQEEQLHLMEDVQMGAIDIIESCKCGYMR